MKKQIKNKKMVAGIAVGMAALFAASSLTSRSVAVGNMDFDQDLAYYMENNGYAKENYVVSPTSIRLSMGLLYEGGSDEVKEELLDVMKFDSEDEMYDWSNMLSDTTAGFTGEFQENNSYIINSALWNNSDLSAIVSRVYSSSVQEHWHADTYEVSAKDITEEVNNWLSEGTNGRIDSMGGDLSKESMLLLNTIYLNSSWRHKFKESSTKKDRFRTINNEWVDKQFMSQWDDFKYYEDVHGKLIILPMEGGIDAVFVLGDIRDYKDAIKKAKLEEDVHVKLPKFDIEDTYDKEMFMDYMVAHGADQTFNDINAFCKMTEDESPAKITSIMQNAKIKVDEGGVEAVAASMMCIAEMSSGETKKPKEFIANKPFKFYICTGENDEIVLFEGQYVK